MKIYKIKKYENIIASKFFDDNNLLCIVDEEGMIRFLDKNYSLVLEYNSKMQPKELIFNNANKILLVGKYELRIFSTPQYIVKNQNIFLK